MATPGEKGDYSMDKAFEDKISRIMEDRRYAHEQLTARKSKVYKSSMEMEKNAFSGGSLDRRIKEIIALGISAVINCESCMEWHIKQALDSGAKEKEIIEAIEVWLEMGGGPATVSSRFALRVLEYYRGK